MENQSEICRANARQCRENAEKIRAPEDRAEFIAFAESWDRLASQIEHDQRLIELIDELASGDASPAAELKDECSPASSLWGLATLMSDHVAAESKAAAA